MKLFHLKNKLNVSKKQLTYTNADIYSCVGINNVKGAK